MSVKRQCMYITVVIIGYLWLNYVKRGPVYESDESLEGKTVLITGGNAGIGKETAKALAKKNARVIIASRNIEKSKKVCKKFVEETENKQIRAMYLDLGDFDSVRSFAKEFDKTEENLDYLINNAGMVAINGFSQSGVNNIYAINYFGPFLLTNLLLDKMKTQSKTRPVRIINLSAEAYKLGKFTEEGMYKNVTSVGDMIYTYCDSKLANIYFTHELNEKLEEYAITTYAIHPGVIWTELVDDLPIPFALRVLLQMFIYLFTRDTYYGIQTILYCALDDDVTQSSGGYFSNCQHSELWSHAMNETAEQNLWIKSLELTLLN